MKPSSEPESEWVPIELSKDGNYTYYWSDSDGQAWKASKDEIDEAIRKNRKIDWTKTRLPIF